MAEMQWMSDQEVTSALRSGELMGRLQDELADTLIYLVRLADVVGLDLAQAAKDKIERNEIRYPVALAQ